MIEIQTLALWSPVALVVFVSAIVLLEEMSNTRDMRREKAAAEALSQTEMHRGHMTIEPGRYVFENKFDIQTKRRAS